MFIDQVRDDSGSNKLNTREGGETWWNPGFTLKAKPTGLLTD